MKVDPLAALSQVDSSERRTAQQFVVETLRRALISGELPFGVRLGQQALAAQLGVSTTPIREAFQELSAEGFLRIDPYRGAFVREPNPIELHDIYDLRIAVESHGMRLTIERISSEEIARADALVSSIDTVQDRAELVCLNRDFHRLLAEATRAPTVAQVLNMLANVSVMYVAFSLRANPKRVVESNHEHREIIRACRERDVEKGIHSIERHLRATLELAESLIR